MGAVLPGLINGAEHRRKINAIETDFVRRERAFKLPPINFPTKGSSAGCQEPPPLNFDSNTAFLEHKDWVAHALRELDDMQISAEGAELSNQKGSLTSRIREHAAGLDRAVRRAWAQKQIEATLRRDSECQPQLIDCSEWS